MLHVFETYGVENCGYCREWFCAQTGIKSSLYVKVGVVHCIEELERRNKTQIRRLGIVGRTAGCEWARNKWEEYGKKAPAVLKKKNVG